MGPRGGEGMKRSCRERISKVSKISIPMLSQLL